MGLENKLSSDDENRLGVIKGIVERLYSKAKGTAGAYVPHDECHCKKVQEYLDKIVTEDALNRMTKAECFLVLCGAWLHDVGMIPLLFGPGDISNIDDVRKCHHVRSVKYVDNNWEALGLERYEVPPIRDLCQYHRRSENLQDLASDGRLQYLAALLRLADACHSDYTRIPEDTYRLNLAVGISPEQLLHWVKSLIVDKVQPNHENTVIELNAIVPPRGEWFNADFRKLTNLVVEDLKHELDGAKYCLARNGITFTEVEVVNVNHVRTANDWGIYEALCAYELPRYPSAGIVLDSVLATLNVIVEKAEVDKIEERYKKALDSALKNKSHHLGLLRLKDEMDRACSGKSGSSLRRAIRQCTKQFGTWQRQAQARIADLAVEKEIVSKSDCILVYSYSSCVLTLLKKIPRGTQKTVNVYVGELRSKSVYDALGQPVYNDGHQLALALVEMGYHVTLLSDAAIPHFLEKGHIKKVLTGANGIGTDGRSSHPVGHLMVAGSAKQYEVPFYVVAESFKLGDLDEIEEDRPNLWLCGPYDTMLNDLTEHGVEVPKPKQDIVPAEMISYFVTEEGFFEPARISELKKLVIERPR